jgi:ribonuclease R
VRQELRGERTGVRYGVGTRVRVQVSRVDLDGRKIDFRMVREGEGDRLLSAGRPDRARVQASAVDQLAAVQSADRVAKAARSKARKSTPSGKSRAARPAGKTASRKRS